MKEVSGEALKTVKILPKDVEMAKKAYQTEKYEEDIWEKALNETDDYIEAYDVEIGGLEDIVRGLDVKKETFSDNVESLSTSLDNLVNQYTNIKSIPEDKLTKDQVEFLKTYEDNKKELEMNLAKERLGLEELDNVIKIKDAQIENKKLRKSMIESHKELRVEPRYEKEVAEAKEAYDNWQELKKKFEEQDVVFDLYEL